MIGFVYAFVLTEPYMIFEKLVVFLERKLPTWLFKPIIGCERCVTGQITLWVFVFIFGTNCTGYFTTDILVLLKTFFTHVYFVCFAIYTCVLLKKLYNK